MSDPRDMSDDPVEAQEVPANQDRENDKKRKLADDAKRDEEQSRLEQQELKALLLNVPRGEHLLLDLNKSGKTKKFIDDKEFRRVTITQHLASFSHTELAALTPLAQTDWAGLKLFPRRIKIQSVSPKIAKPQDEDEDESSDEENAAPVVDKLPDDLPPDLNLPSKVKFTQAVDYANKDLLKDNGTNKGIRSARRAFKNACEAYLLKYANDPNLYYVKVLNGVVLQWAVVVANLNVYLSVAIPIVDPEMMWIIGRGDHLRFLNRMNDALSSLVMLPQALVTSKNRLLSSVHYLGQAYQDMYVLNIDSFTFDKTEQKAVNKSFVELIDAFKRYTGNIFEIIGYSTQFPFWRTPTERVIGTLDKRGQRQVKGYMNYPTKYSTIPGRGGYPRGRGGRARGGPKMKN